MRRGDCFWHPHWLEADYRSPQIVQVTKVNGDTIYYRTLDRETGQMVGTSWYTSLDKVSTWERIAR